MQRHFRTSLLFVVAAVCAPVGCDATIAGVDDAATSTDDGNSPSEEFHPCSADNPCPDGQFCFNGVCAVGCTSDADCSTNHYCDTTTLLCHRNEVEGCGVAGDCEADQVCTDGFCSTPTPSTSCDFENYLEDGCETTALCFEQDNGAGACFSMPACSADGTCPVGPEGAVCNNGLLSSKDAICLPGYCTAAEHCPASSDCVQPSGAGTLGLCSSGAVGTPCVEPAQCLSGMCNAITGFIGFCS